ncbi:Glycoside hydrolase, family 43 [Rhodopirellula sp. SWK7]|nr:Glycoside hydrolase, family 43 [Rhodopirellula sp. SWK7]
MVLGRAKLLRKWEASFETDGSQKRGLAFVVYSRCPATNDSNRYTSKQNPMKLISMFFCVICLLIGIAPHTVQAQSQGTASFTRTTLSGIGPDKSVSRRDPSDVIKVGGLYYVWYCRGLVKTGYNATVWYATSPDGMSWTEMGEAVGKGEAGAWDEASVFTPNVLVAEDKYWLFYTAISRSPKVKPDSKIGIAVSDSPDGPWQKLAANTVLRNSDNESDFDSHLVDDSCLMVRDGKYWCYYKGRQLGKGAAETKMGLAIAESPGGPYIRHPKSPVIPGNHEVVVWPQGPGVVAMVDELGPKEIANSILYAEDGIHFTKTHDVIDRPKAAGTYRPEAFTDSNQGEAPTWGVEMDPAGKLFCIQRFVIDWERSNENE